MEFIRVQILLTQILCGISIFCSLFTIITYLFFKRKMPGGLVLYFSICSFFISLAGIIHNQLEYTYTPTLCLIQGSILVYFGSSMALWYMIISVNLYIILYLKNKKVTINLVPLFHVIGWLIPLVSTCILLFLKKIGRTDRNWCWIIDSKFENFPIWEFCSFYLIMILSGIIAMISWVLIVILVCKNLYNANLFSGFQLARYIIFIFTYFICFIIFLSEAILTHLNTDSIVAKIFEILDIIFFSSQGIIVFVFFGFSIVHLRKWKNLIFRWYWESE